MEQANATNFDYDTHVSDPAWDAAEKAKAAALAVLLAEHPYLSEPDAEQQQYITEAIAETFKEVLREHYRKAGFEL